MNYVLIPVGADHYLVRFDCVHNVIYIITAFCFIIIISDCVYTNSHFNDDKLLACVPGKRIVSPVNPAPNETCEVKWHYKNVYGATVLFIGKLDN